ncbi:hypothetical protein Btru_055683 [Bulinus truncatus]|nr:hypothetical protein Btru_055683 [Bulinus truncatus]
MNLLATADERLELDKNKNVFFGCLCENTVCDLQIESTGNSTHHVTSVIGNNQSLSDFTASSFICIWQSSDSLQCLIVPQDFRLPSGSSWCSATHNETCSIRFALLMTPLYDADFECDESSPRAIDASRTFSSMTQRSTSSSVNPASKDDHSGSDVALIVGVSLVAVIAVVTVLNVFLALMLRRKHREAIERKERFQRQLQVYNAISVAPVNSVDISYEDEANHTIVAVKHERAETNYF